MSREKNRRLGFISLQIQNTEDNLIEAENDLKIFTDEFDLDMDYNANKAGYERIQDRIQEVIDEQNRRTYFLANAKYVSPTFETVATDIDEIMDFGRIIDNCEYSEPLVMMNTYNFELLEYKQDLKDFNPVKVRGKEI